MSYAFRPSFLHLAFSNIKDTRFVSYPGFFPEHYNANQSPQTGTWTKKRSEKKSVLFPTRWKIHLKWQIPWVMANLWGFVCHSELADRYIQLSYRVISILTVPLEWKRRQLKGTKSLILNCFGSLQVCHSSVFCLLLEKLCLANLKVQTLFWNGLHSRNRFYFIIFHSLWGCHNKNGKIQRLPEG